MRSLVVLAGRSHPALAKLIADRLGVELGQVRRRSTHPRDRALSKAASLCLNPRS